MDTWLIVFWTFLGVCGVIAAVMLIDDQCKPGFDYHGWSRDMQRKQNNVRKVDPAQVNELASVGLNLLAQYRLGSVVWELLVRRWFPKRRKGVERA